jgi:hypothetical protein
MRQVLVDYILNKLQIVVSVHNTNEEKIENCAIENSNIDLKEMADSHYEDWSKDNI